MPNKGDYGAAHDNAGRRGDLDMMRVLFVLGLVFFHAAKIFDHLPYYVKNDRLSITLTALTGFFSQWGMPLLFFMAGFSAWHSLGSRTWGQFVKERFWRLVVPFAFGMLVIVPPIRYYALLATPDYHESYWTFYPRFFDIEFRPGFPGFIEADPATGLYETAHLWFLYYLFAFSVMALPLFVYLRGDAGERLARRLAELLKQRGTILLLALPVVLTEVFAQLGESVGWNRYSFLIFLIFGYVFAADAALEGSLRDDCVIALSAGTLAIAGFFWVSVVTWQSGTDPSRGFALESVLWRSLKAGSSWFWVAGVWGLVQRYRQRERSGGTASRRLATRAALNRYGREAVMPLYLIHQTPVVIIGFYVVKWDVGLPAKYLITTSASILATLLLYESFVKRTTVTRVLFGMKQAPE